MEQEKQNFEIGDIVKIDGNLYLWFGDDYIADTYGLPISFNYDLKLIFVCTKSEAWNYFKQLDKNGLKWNSGHMCFELKNPKMLKFHSGEVAINEYGRRTYVYGVCYEENVLCYLRKEFGIYYATPVDKFEHNFFTETEVNTIPKKMYRIVKMSDKNGIFCDRYYIQERKFGFLWLYIDDPFSFEWIMKYSLTKGGAKLYNTM